jgi:4'-phosphopantetheinyl transferase
MSGRRAGPPLRMTLAWGSTSAVPHGTAWLTAAEREVLSLLRLPKRRRDWRLGRWLAKEAVLGVLADPSLRLGEVEILPTPGGAPVARVSRCGAGPEVAVSLSHSRGAGMATAVRGVLRVGCDVEAVERRSPAFLRDYLTDGEREWVASAPVGSEARAALVWSAKESALKVLGEGLRLDTRSVCVSVPERAPDPSATSGPPAELWRPLRVDVSGGDRLTGWWSLQGDFVWTLLASRSLPAPDRSPPCLSAMTVPLGAGTD